MHEFAGVFFLAYQRFRGLRAHDALVERAGDPGIGLAHLAVVLQNLLLKDHRHHGDDRHDRQHHQRQTRAQGEHVNRGHDDVAHAPRKVDQPPADGVAQSLGVAAHAGDQVADGRLVVKRERQLLKPAEADFADVVRHARFNAAGREAEDENQRHLRQNHQRVANGEAREALQRLVGDEGIDGFRRQKRDFHVDARA